MQVYLSSRLKNRYPFVFQRIADVLSEHEVAYRQLPNTERNEWIRDFMPVHSVGDRWTWFKYDPNYLQSKEGKKTIPERATLEAQIDIEPVLSKLVLDGGSVLVHGERAYISTRVFQDNLNLKHQEVRDVLIQQMGTRQIHFVPQDPWDFTGHLDGLVRALNDNVLLVNDYYNAGKASKQGKPYPDKLFNQWHESFLASLLSSGVHVVQKPLLYFDEKKKSSAVGCYLNFLMTDKVILMPSFGLDSDNSAQHTLQELYQMPVEKIACRELAQEGGALNCVSWEC